MSSDAAASCSIAIENVFGPRVSPSCAQGFDFTLLFEETILTVLPLCLCIIVAVQRLFALWRSPVVTLRPGLIYVAKLVTYGVYIALQVVLLILWATTSVRTRATIPTTVLTIVGFAIFLLLSHLEHQHSVRPSTTLNLYLAFTALLDVARTRTLFLMHYQKPIAAIFLTGLIIKLVLFLLETIEKRSILKFRPETLSKEATSGIFDRLLLLWVNPVFWLGFRSLLSVKMLPRIEESLTANDEKLFARWRANDSESRYALLLTFAWHYRWDILIGVPPKLAWIALSFAQPFLIERVLDYTSEPRNANSKNIAYGLIGAYALVYIGVAISYTFYQHKIDRLILKVRGSLISLVFSKTLRMSTTSISDASALTLMSADIDRIGNGLREIGDFWSAFIEIPIVIWLIERLLGVAVVGPVIYLMVLLIIGIPIANAAGNFQNDWLEAIEERLAVTSQALGVMKHLKMTGAADAISEIITDLRKDEIRASGLYRLGTTFVLTISYASEAFAPVIGFGTFIVLAERRGTGTLTQGIAFSALTLFALLDQPMTTLVDGLEELKTVVNCFERIQDQLAESEREDYRTLPGSMRAGRASTSTSSLPTSEAEAESSGTELADMSKASRAAPSASVENIASLRGASAAWSDDDDVVPTLTELTCDFPSGQTTMVVGPIGSGKTTLLRLLMGEIPVAKGLVSTSFRDAAYCSQAAWIRTGSIQQNILGVSLWDDARYSEVLRVCDLKSDFDELPERDETQVGAKGSRLSGGQQTRIALARALYSEHPVMLLDDPLTGLDRATEQNVLGALFGPRGFVKRAGRSVIMATNSIHHLSYADHVIILDGDGKIDDKGDPTVLCKTNSYLKRLAVDPLPISQAKVPEMQPTEEQLEDMEDSEYADILDQSRRTGDLKVYMYYFQTAGWGVIALYLLTAVCFTFGSNFATVWIQLWTNSNDADGTQRVGYWVGIYALLGAILLLSTFLSSFVLLMMMVPITARRFHQYLLSTTIHATTSFLTSTDIGTTTNRFSQDLQLIDLDLPQVFETTILSILGVIVEAILIFVGSGYVAIAIPGVLVVVYLIQNFYLRTSRQLRLLDIEAKAPLFSHFLEVLGGLASIRCYGWESQYLERNRIILENSQKPYYLLFTVQRWLTLVLNLVVAGIAIILVAVVTTRTSSATSLLGVALFNVVDFGSSLEQLVTDWTQLEQSIGAVSRIRSFVTSTASEDVEDETAEPPEDWPTKGQIEYKGVTAQYEESQPVLKDINVTFQAGHKIAICGRTGSGKSSLISTLLRMLELTSGTIIIDNIDISTLPRSLVRSHLNTLPQQTFFLHGSVRLNLDPQGLVDDDKVFIHALTAVGLWRFFEKDGLEEDLDEETLSHGQKQLFCLARAMCKPGCILILDEATSSVDADTEILMTRIIHEHFAKWTVIAIAHKLDSVLDYGQVLVLDKGEVVESGRPRELLEKRGSHFRTLYESRGSGGG